MIPPFVCGFAFQAEHNSTDFRRQRENSDFRFSMISLRLSENPVIGAGGFRGRAYIRLTDKLTEVKACDTDRVDCFERGQPMADISELFGLHHFVGRVEWIGIAQQKGGSITRTEQVELVTNGGIAGEHHFQENSPSHRQVTLIQYEHLPVIAALLQRQEVDPAALRRNIAVSGINIASLRTQQFSIGGAVLQGTGDCVPCALMEKTLGTGGYEAMVAHGGITTVVVEGGAVKCGDLVEVRKPSNV